VAFSLAFVSTLIFCGALTVNPLNERFSYILALRQSLSWLIIPLYIYVIKSQRLGLSARVLNFIVVIWVAVSIIQHFIPGFMHSFLPRATTTMSRGVTSLATEPFEYGRMALIQLLLSYYLYLSRKMSRFNLQLNSLLLIVSVIIFSRSATAVVYLFIIALIYSFASSRNLILKARKFALYVVSAVIVLVLGSKYFSDWRLFEIINVLIENPIDISNQGAFTQRVYNTPFAIRVGLFGEFPFGRGLGKEVIISDYVVFDYIFYVKRAISNNAHGGMVGAIYQGGLLGLFWIYMIVSMLLRSDIYRNQQKGKFLVFGALLLCFFEGSLVNPAVAYLVAILIAFKDKKKNVR